MKYPRLNVTEDERLCYSRRKLQAISALRNADLELPSDGLHKDYRAPGVRGRVYLVLLPDGSVTHFTRLADMVNYANDYRAFRQVQAFLAGTEHTISWEDWQQHGVKRAKAEHLAASMARAAIPSVRWQRWVQQQQQVPVVQSEPSAILRCAWKDGCSYDAVPDSAYCAGHAFMARQIHALTAGRG